MTLLYRAEVAAQYEGVRTTYEEITDEEAAAWLVANEHEPHEACAEQFAALEIK